MTATAQRSETLDAAVADLRAGAVEWARTPVATKRALLAESHAAIAASAAEWVGVAARVKRLADDSPLVGEEWITGPYALLSYTRALIQTLEAIETGRDPLAPYDSHAAPGDRVAIRVLPADHFDYLLLNGYRVDVWLPPGVSRADAAASLGRQLRHPDGGGVSLVLGAGNISSIAPLDVLYKLYADNRVVLLKPNPVTRPLQPLLERVFAPFIARGFLRVCSGDGQVGEYLTRHPGVDDVHLTGSAATHNAVVFGPGEAGASRRAARRPLLEKPVTSELGGVSPTIVLPGRWSASDLRFQAQNLATQRLHNTGSNCVATQIVILPSEWAQRDRFLACLRDALHDAPARELHYPGVPERLAQALDEHPEAERLGGDPPRLLLSDLDPADADPAFSCEYFGPALGVVSLPGEPADYLKRAVEFANERLLGALGAGLIVDPRTRRALGPDLWEAVRALRYGAIAVNCWTAVDYLTPRAAWGAFPGESIFDVQSGIGVVHNALLLDQVERSVAQGPFRPLPRSLPRGEMAISPKPPWFVNNRTAALTGRRLTSFAASPRWRALPAIFAAALRG
jgi:aldehyde dehydrogenase (NAD(P)+)